MEYNFAAENMFFDDFGPEGGENCLKDTSAAPNLIQTFSCGSSLQSRARALERATHDGTSREEIGSKSTDFGFEYCILSQNVTPDSMGKVSKAKTNVKRKFQAFFTLSYGEAGKACGGMPGHSRCFNGLRMF